MKLQITLLGLLAYASAQDVDVSGFGPIHGPFHGSGPRHPITSKDLRDRIVLPNLLNHAHKFLGFSKLSNGTRSYGTDGYNSTVGYIKKLLDSTGFYHTEYQSLPYPLYHHSPTFSVAGQAYNALGFDLTPAGVVTAPLIVASNLGCTPADYPENTKGKIVLVKRGDCQFGAKTAVAGGAGAAGVIIYNNVVANWTGGTLSVPSRPEGPYVPTIGLRIEEGEALVKLVQESKLEVIGSLNVAFTYEERYSSNLIATTKSGKQNDLVFLGAHSDSVPAGPGLNDNGSGSISILELALNLPRYTFKNAVRFAWWTTEEQGLVGSKYYVANLSEKEKSRIALYLNFDMTASPNAGHFVLDGDGDTHGLAGPPGSAHIESTFQTYYNTSAKVRSAAGSFSGGSDYQPFFDAGFPAGGLQTGAGGIKTAQQVEWWGGEAGIAYDKCYHQACDVIENLNTKAWLIITKGAAHALATYANSLDGIPRNRTVHGLSKVQIKPATEPVADGGSCGAHSHTRDEL